MTRRGTQLVSGRTETGTQAGDIHISHHYLHRFLVTVW